MKEIKTAQEVVEAIDYGYETTQREDRAREYIGASIVGNTCDAFLSFNLRGFPNDEPSPRLKRIFRLGHLLEDEVVKDLKEKADVRVWEVDGITGRQFSYELYGGHVSCHMDGHVELDDKVLRVLEIKSMNDASFKKFQKSGVKISHPQYFAQVQMMMGMSGMSEAFFIAVNKNNSEYHAEIVVFDEFEYSHLLGRVETSLKNEARKIATDDTDWRCRGCFKRSVCWSSKEVKKSCVTCIHSYPMPNGSWHCTIRETEGSLPCEKYETYKPKERI